MLVIEAVSALYFCIRRAIDSVSVLLLAICFKKDFSFFLKFVAESTQPRKLEFSYILAASRSAEINTCAVCFGVLFINIIVFCHEEWATNSTMKLKYGIYGKTESSCFVSAKQLCDALCSCSKLVCCCCNLNLYQHFFILTY